MVNWMLLTILFIGVLLGIIAHRTNFCIMGAFLDFFTSGSTIRLKAVLAAIFVFMLIFLFGVDYPMEYAGLKHVIGGLIQGVGYTLAAGCPLALLVRLGEGSKYHTVVLISFLIGLIFFYWVGIDLKSFSENFVFFKSISLFKLN